MYIYVCMQVLVLKFLSPLEHCEMSCPFPMLFATVVIMAVIRHYT